MNTIVIPFGLPSHWSADYEKQTAMQLAKQHIVIAFLVGEGISIQRYLQSPQRLFYKVRKNFYIYRPLYIIPFQRFPFIRNINFRLAAYLVRFLIAYSPWKYYKKIYWSFSLQYAVFPSYFGRHFFSIYDCVDTFGTENKTIQKQWKHYEKKIMKESTMILVNSSVLYAQKKHTHPHVFQTGEGLFAHEIFDKPSKKKEPTDLSAIPRPRITFIGNINKRLDFSLIKTLASMTPNYSYIFVGREDSLFDGHPNVNFSDEIHKLKKRSNIYFLGKKPKSTMRAYIQYSDVGFIPYDLSLKFNRFCYPMKIQEYFYMGKPVLCTAIEEVKKLVPYVSIFHSAQDAKKKLQEILSKPWPFVFAHKQKQIAKNNSIAEKLRQVENILKKNFSDQF